MTTTGKKTASTRLKKILLWSVVGLVVLGILGAVAEKFGWDTSAPSAKQDTPKPTSTSTGPRLMPNAVGLTFAKATEILQPYDVSPDYIDLLESRSVWDDANWIVKAQVPAAGSELHRSDRVCLGVVKIDESWKDNLKRLSCWDSASDAENDAFDFDINESHDIILATLLNESSQRKYYKVLLSVELDDPSLNGVKLKLRFCTNDPVNTGRSVGVPMELIPADDRQRYDRDVWAAFSGSFTYTVDELEKNPSGSCVYG